MPFYNVLHPQGSFDQETKQKLAKAVTDMHCEFTGSPPQLVHVIFAPGDHADIFSGGQASLMVLIRAFTRAGRPQELKEKMLRALTEIFVSVGNVPLQNLMVTMIETPATNAMEAGVILPHPGDDAEWHKLNRIVRSAQAVSA